MTKLLAGRQAENTGPNRLVTIPLPLGTTINKVLLELGGGITKSVISDIVLKLNNAEKLRYKTADHLQKINSYRGLVNDVGLLEIDFTEPGAGVEDVKFMGTLATTQEAGIQSAVLELKLGAYTATASDKLKMYVEHDAPSGNKVLTRTRVGDLNINAAMEYAYQLPFGLNGEQFKRFYIMGDVTKIDAIRIRRQGVDEYENIPVNIANLVQKSRGKTPQADMLVIDFMLDSLINHVLNTSKVNPGTPMEKWIDNMEMIIKTNAAVNLSLYSESYSSSDRA